MSTRDSNDWVREGTPREEWDSDTDYGVEIEPSEWDDYSEEQSVPVPTPAAAMDYQPPGPDTEPEHQTEPEPEAGAEPEFQAGPEDHPEAEHEPEAAEHVAPERAADPEPERAAEPDLHDDTAADDPDATAQYAVVTDEEPEADEEITVETEEVVVEEDLEPEAGRAADEDPAAEDDTEPAALGGLYRNDLPSEDATQVIDQSPLEREQAAEEERLARLQEQRDARDARLGVVPGSDTDGVRVVPKPVKRQSDRFFGAFSLFVLRLVTAAIIGVLGFQVLQDIDASEAFFATTVLPEPRLVSWILGSLLIVGAFLLVIGLGVRVIGALLLAISITSLVTIRWGAFSIFVENMEGFLGDRTLLMAAVSLTLLAFGGGAWSIDGAIRGAREESRAARND